jgi:hypothetical protein
LSASQILYAREVGVAVQNPQPAGSMSNVVDFTIQPWGWLYLPVIVR